MFQILLVVFISATGTVHTVDHELVQEASNMILEALNEITSDPINNRTTTIPNYGNMVQDFSKSITTLFLSDNALLKSKGEKLLQFIDKEISSTNFSKTPSREEFWKVIMDKLQSQQFAKDWSDVLSKLVGQQEKKVISGFFYQLTTTFMKLVLAFKSDKADAEKPKPDLKLSDEEQQVVYYVTGFLAYALRKRHRKICSANPENTSALSTLQFCESLHYSEVKGKNFLDYVKDWVRVRVQECPNPSICNGLLVSEKLKD